MQRRSRKGEGESCPYRFSVESCAVMDRDPARHTATRHLECPRGSLCSHGGVEARAGELSNPHAGHPSSCGGLSSRKVDTGAVAEGHGPYPKAYV